MTSYKMKPPTAIFGTIKVGDEVTVVFDLIMTHLQIAKHLNRLVKQEINDTL